MSALHTIAHPRQLAFLSVYPQVGTVSAAAKGSGVGRRTHYHWLSTDSEYRQAYETTREYVCAQIEDGLVERLIHGSAEPVFYNGEKVGERRKFDNSAAIAYLDRHSQCWREAKALLNSKTVVRPSNPNSIEVHFDDSFFGRAIEDAT